MPTVDTTSMSLMSFVVQCTIIPLITWVLWTFRAYLVPSPLDNISGPPSASLWKGNHGQLFDRHGWDFRRDIGQNYGRIVKLAGLFGRRHLYVFDPLALYSILVKDQHRFEHPTFILTHNQIMFGQSLLSTTGEHHRKQRKMLNPLFSTKHMRDMMPIFYEVTYRLRSALISKTSNGTEELDMLDWMSRTTMELVGQAGFGYSFDRLVEDIPNEFGDAIKSLLPTFHELANLLRLAPFLPQLGSAGFRRRLVEWFPDRRVQKLRHIIDLMEEKSWEIVRTRKQALQQDDYEISSKVGVGKDIISILLKANMEADEEDRLPDTEVVGQITSLTFAATDPTSNALSHLLYLLAEHPHIQETLRAEITAARGGNDLSYDQLVELPYLDAVCREMLRLYPPVSHISREACEDAVLPLSEPIRGRDGMLIYEIVVPKGTAISVGILASNRNKSMWGEDSFEFKPERWLKPLPTTVSNAHIPGVYANLMTFLGGSRSCIGFMFFQLEMKVVLSILMENFTFALADAEIVWNVAGIQYPTVGKLDQRARLPMKVTLISKA